MLRVVPPGVDPTQAATRSRPWRASRLGRSSVTARRRRRHLPGRRLPQPRPSATPASAGGAIGLRRLDLATAPPIAAAPPRRALRATPTTRSSGSWPANGTVVVQFDEQRSRALDRRQGGRPCSPPPTGASSTPVPDCAATATSSSSSTTTPFSRPTRTTRRCSSVEDQAVKRGQKIAEMGSTDAERGNCTSRSVRQGKPVDPAKLLPPLKDGPATAHGEPGRTGRDAPF